MITISLGMSKLTRIFKIQHTINTTNSSLENEDREIETKLETDIHAIVRQKDALNTNLILF